MIVLLHNSTQNNKKKLKLKNRKRFDELVVVIMIL